MAPPVCQGQQTRCMQESFFCSDAMRAIHLLQHNKKLLAEAKRKGLATCPLQLLLCVSPSPCLRPSQFSCEPKVLAARIGLSVSRRVQHHGERKLRLVAFISQFGLWHNLICQHTGKLGESCVFQRSPITEHADLAFKCFDKHLEASLS